MTDAQLRDQAVALLEQTTIPYTLWVRKGRPAKTNWGEALALLAQIGPKPAPPPVPAGSNPVPPPASGCHFGAYVDVTTMGVSSDALAWDKFETDAGRRAAVMMFGHPHFFAGTTFDPDGRLAFCNSRGAIPLLDVDTSQDGSGGHTLTIANYNQGLYDANIDKAAHGCAAYGKPMLLRVDAEMNGGWYSYGSEIRANAGGAAAFVAMWQRIVTRIRAIAPNVAFHWCPNVDPDHYQATTIESVWPGDAFVDWAGMTGYNHGNETVAYVFDDAYKRVTALTGKPIQIGETGSVDSMGSNNGTSNPSKAQWISDLAAWLPAHPQVKGFCWFNWHITEGGTVYDWEIESSPAAQAAFKQLASSHVVAP